MVRARCAAVRATSSGVDLVEELEADRAPRRLVTGLHAGVGHRHAVDAEAGAHPVVLDEQAVGVGDEHPSPGVGVGRGDLADRIALGAGGVVGPLEHLGLAGLLDRLREDLTLRCGGLHRPALQGGNVGGALLTTRRGGRGLGGVAEPRLGEVGGVGKARGVAPDDADARAPFATGDELLDLAVVEPGRRHPAILDEDLGEITASAKGRLQGPLKNCLFDQLASHGGCLS